MVEYELKLLNINRLIQIEEKRIHFRFRSVPCSLLSGRTTLVSLHPTLYNLQPTPHTVHRTPYTRFPESGGKHMKREEEVQGSICCRGSGKYMHRALALVLPDARVERGRSRYLWKDRYEVTWKRELKHPWCEAGPPNHLDDKVDPYQ